jgi:hypothetical protein
MGRLLGYELPGDDASAMTSSTSAAACSAAVGAETRERCLQVAQLLRVRAARAA